MRVSVLKSKILGPDSGWQRIPLAEVITSAAVKKAYRKATLCVHPDKLQQRGASVQQKYICEKVFDLLKIEIFPFSVFYIFFEQYLDIWDTAVINIAIALGAVFLVCLVITSSLWSSAIIVLVLAMIVVDLLGVMAILDIQLYPVFVEAVAVVWRRANSTGLAWKTNQCV